jgi:hypothetical protein
MSPFLKNLQAVHDELTRLMAESRMDVPTRQKLAGLANQLADVSQQLAITTAGTAQESEVTEPNRPKRRTLIRRAMDLLMQAATFVQKYWWNNDGT